MLIFSETGSTECLQVHDGGQDELPEEAVQLPEAEPERGLSVPEHLRPRDQQSHQLLRQEARDRLHPRRVLRVELRQPLRRLHIGQLRTGEERSGLEWSHTAS